MSDRRKEIRGIHEQLVNGCRMCMALMESSDRRVNDALWDELKTWIDNASRRIREHGRHRSHGS